jgi:predicted membrane protein
MMKFIKLLNKSTQRGISFLYGIAGAFTMLVSPAFAADADPFSMLRNLINFLIEALIYVGAAGVIFGIVQLAISFSSHDASQRMQGIMGIVGGMLLIGVKVLMTQFGVEL